MAHIQDLRSSCSSDIETAADGHKRIIQKSLMEPSLYRDKQNKKRLAKISLC